ncbi:MAG: nucleotidyl transferase AbiEii/AbiGii toxin family protein [Chlorobium sp.]|nr:MAG: nucleotidyl transferase AbiEii/AbiGii toxin family protein [Chlorobium sp.]
MTRTPENIPASIRQRLLQESRKLEIDFNLMLTKYALERFLYRLSVSPYHDRFVLKGAMLFQLWGIDSFRPTRDLDLLGFGETEQEHLVKVFREICQIEVADDGISFDPESVTVSAIRDQMEYGGSRIVINAELAKARIQVQIDIGFGDVVTPQPTEHEYPTLLKLPAPVLRAYPRETVVAEKIQAMVALGIANSRMKDLYDLWFIGSTFQFDGAMLVQALKRTFVRQDTDIPKELPFSLSDDFADDSMKISQWRAFIRRTGVQAPEELMSVILFLRDFLMPPITAAAADRQFSGIWTPDGKWSQ